MGGRYSCIIIYIVSSYARISNLIYFLLGVISKIQLIKIQYLTWRWLQVTCLLEGLVLCLKIGGGGNGGEVTQSAYPPSVP
ncbi:hypothetical protein ACFX2G_032314 [Malus domestica]